MKDESLGLVLVSRLRVGLGLVQEVWSRPTLLGDQVDMEGGGGAMEWQWNGSGMAME